MTGSTYALLLGVEHYQQDGLPAVPFAIADAYAMRDILIQQMNVPPENIKLWVDQEATQNRLKQEIPYEIRGLGPEDCYIFFYAGHGFYAAGWNRITTWDTHAFNLADTTTCPKTGKHRRAGDRGRAARTHVQSRWQSQCQRVAIGAARRGRRRFGFHRKRPFRPVSRVGS